MTEERLTHKTEEMGPERENVVEEDPPWGWTGFKGKTLWDWLALLIVPAMLIGLGLGFNRIEKGQEERAAQIAANATDTREAVQITEAAGTSQAEKTAETNRQTEQATTAKEAATLQAVVEETRIAAQSTIEANRINEDILEAYFDDMSSLILETENITKAGIIERARTLSILSRLDGKRNGRVLQFLTEAELMNLIKEDLDGVDLSEANLREAHLGGANLREAHLGEAYLIGARYDDETKWPDGFDPEKAGAIQVEE